MEDWSDFQMHNIRPCKVVLAPLTVDMCNGITPCCVALKHLKEINLYTKRHNERLKKHWTISKRSAVGNKIYLQSKMSDSGDSENESLMTEENFADSVKDLKAKCKSKAKRGPYRKKINPTASKKSSCSKKANINLSEKYLSRKNRGSSDSKTEENFADSVKKSKAKRKNKAKHDPYRKKIDLTASRKSSRFTTANINLCEKYLASRNGGGSDSESSDSSEDDDSVKWSDFSDSENESKRKDSSFSENESPKGSDCSYKNYSYKSRAKVKKRKSKQKKVPEPLSDYEKLQEIKRQKKMAFLKNLNFNEFKEMCHDEKKKPKPKELTGIQIPLRCSSRSTRSKLFLCLDDLSKKSAGDMDSEINDSSDSS